MRLKKLHLFTAVGLLLAAVIGAGFIEGMVGVRSPVVVAATGDVKLEVQISLAQFYNGSCNPTVISITMVFSQEQFKTASSIINSVSDGASSVVEEATNSCGAAAELLNTYNQDVAQGLCQSYSPDQCLIDELAYQMALALYQRAVTALQNLASVWNASFQTIGGVPESVSIISFTVDARLSLDNQLPIEILGATGQLEGQKFDVNVGTTTCGSACSLDTTVTLHYATFPGLSSWHPEQPIKPTISIDIGVPEQWGFPPSLWIRYGTTHSTMNVTLEITPSTGFVGLAKN